MKRVGNIVTGLLVALVLLLALFAIGNQNPVKVRAQTDEQVSTSGRVITVTGQGKVQVQPDIATVGLGVQTEADTAEDALDENNVRMQDLISTTLESGVAEEDIQTQVLRLQPIYEQPSGDQQQPTLTGYRATNTVQITVRDLANLGVVLDGAVEAGGNTIDSIQFELSDPEEAARQAREAAMNDATAKAEQLTSLAGAQLGEVLTIDEQGSSPPPVIFAEPAASPSESAVPVQAGSQTVEANVSVSWQIR